MIQRYFQVKYPRRVSSFLPFAVTHLEDCSWYSKISMYWLIIANDCLKIQIIKMDKWTAIFLQTRLYTWWALDRVTWKNPRYETGSNWADNLKIIFSFERASFLIMFHRRYSNCRPQNCARCNRIIRQTIENTSFLERLLCVLHAFAKVTEVTNLISHFTLNRLRNPANLGSKSVFVFAERNTP